MDRSQPPPGSGDAGAERRETEALAARALVAARARHGAFALDAAAFLARVTAVAERHWRAQGFEPTAERRLAYARKAALEDLYLASACEAGDAAAWSRLAREYRPRLEALLLRRGRSPAEAEARAQDLLGDLASPPPRGGARTLLGLYDAAGSLFGWLCVVLVRRVAADQRGRRPGPLDVVPDEALADAEPLAAGTEAGASDARAAGGEDVAQFAVALGPAWASLTSQERLALLFKHRDGLTQRQIGTLLGVGEARVSRVVAAALDKLSSSLKPALGHSLPEQREFLAHLAGTLARHLAREVPAPPTGAAPRAVRADRGNAS